MAVPTNQVFAQGQGAVSGDQLNTFLQNTLTTAQLRLFVGKAGMLVAMDGTTTAGDGGFGFFYWNATGVAPDDNGVTTIKPPAAATGEWTRLKQLTTFTAAIPFRVDGGGSTPSTGVVGDLYVPFSGTISTWVLQADQTGSMVIDIWKAPFVANTPPTVANTITALALPTLTTSESALSTTLTGWTTNVNAGDWIRFNINSISTITRFTLTLVVTGVSG